MRYTGFLRLKLAFMPANYRGEWMIRIGVAMLQGARHEHKEALIATAKELAVEIEIIELRRADQVDNTLDGLILPGGESTAMRKASESELLLPALFDWMQQFPEKPVLGTCAGAILLASPGEDYQPFIDVGISRNAWGRQRNSFEAEVKLLPLILDSITLISAASKPILQQRDKFNHKPLDMSHEAAQLNDIEENFPGIFIRAPRFEQDTINCQKVATMEDEVVGIMQGNKVAVTFHPELTLERRFHTWLISNCNP